MVQEAGKTLLAQRLIAEDGGAVCQIEAPGLRAYWYADAAITVFFTQIRGQPDSLLAEHKRHVAGKIRLDIAARRLGGGEPDIAIAMLCEKIADGFFPYILPQDSSNVTEVREARLYGRGELKISSQKGRLFELSTYPCTADEIELATHYWHLPQRDFNVVNISARNMGLGGIHSWGHIPLPEHRIETGRTYEMSFMLKGGR